MKFKPSSIHVFWDAPRATVWRRNVLPGYKDRASTETPGSDRDIGAELAEFQKVAMEYLPLIGIRQYHQKTQEADDLIYAACRASAPKSTIIISSDCDFTQIPFMMSHVHQFDPRTGQFMEKAKNNPVIKKSLMGDTSDKIKGYMGIGPVKSETISESSVKIQEFLTNAGSHPFITNMLMIDLSLSPHVLANQLYVTRVMARPIVFDKDAAISAISSNKLYGLFEDFSKVVMPLKELVKNVDTI